jgi:hypothetical protein
VDSVDDKAASCQAASGGDRILKAPLVLAVLDFAAAKRRELATPVLLGGRRFSGLDVRPCWHSRCTTVAQGRTISWNTEAHLGPRTFSR